MKTPKTLIFPDEIHDLLRCAASVSTVRMPATRLRRPRQGAIGSAPTAALPNSLTANWLPRAHGNEPVCDKKHSIRSFPARQMNVEKCYNFKVAMRGLI